MTAMHGHWILLVSFCLNHSHVHYDTYAWPLDSIGVILSKSLACALWQLNMATGFHLWHFVWITFMCIMTAKYGHWILLVSFCLNHLYVHYDSYAWTLDSIGVFCLNHLHVHYDSYAWPLDSIGVFLSESIACALSQLSMATGFYWCLFFWITCMCIMTGKHVHWILWCLCLWIICMCIMTAMNGHWILLVSFCLNQLYVHYDSYACPLDCIGVFLSESLACALWQLCMATGFYGCLFVWIYCMCIMRGKHVHWILLVSFCLNHLHVHYDS